MIAADISVERHHHAFTDRVDRWVGHLGRLLAMEETLWRRLAMYVVGIRQFFQTE
ncbi:Uncharacterised protein [Vibrio cholerae]|nr:Uncharacterised protein [Vibrio cholerae]